MLHGMSAPRWFYLVLAACAVTLTAAAVMRMRYAPATDAYFDAYRRAICTAHTCTPLARDVVPLEEFHKRDQLRRSAYDSLPFRP